MNTCPILPDVQASKPAVPISLTRVGVTDVKKLVRVQKDGKKPIVLTGIFDIFVDLPSDRKGANLSRNFEAIDETLNKIFELPTYHIEDLCSDVAENLLERHEYAKHAEVRMKSEYVLKKKAPASKIAGHQFVDIFAEAVAERNDVNGTDISVKKMIGAEVTGITACPCAQSIMTETAEKELLNLGVDEKTVQLFLQRVPMATHNQRGRGIISIKTADTKHISLSTIIEIIEESMSSNIFEVLKRADEKIVVEKAHRNPKFVEDCVRTMAQKVIEKFPDISDDSIVTIKQINEESIHKHNAFAERVATIGEIKEELNNNSN